MEMKEKAMKIRGCFSNWKKSLMQSYLESDMSKMSDEECLLAHRSMMLLELSVDSIAEQSIMLDIINEKLDRILASRGQG